MAMENKIEWLTTSELATKLGVSQRRILKMCQDGELEAVKKGWVWFINPKSSALKNLRGKEK